MASLVIIKTGDAFPEVALGVVVVSGSLADTLVSPLDGLVVDLSAPVAHLVGLVEAGLQRHDDPVLKLFHTNDMRYIYATHDNVLK